jgi:hypothetical protein
LSLDNASSDIAKKAIDDALVDDCLALRVAL